MLVHCRRVAVCSELVQVSSPEHDISHAQLSGLATHLKRLLYAVHRRQRRRQFEKLFVGPNAQHQQGKNSDGAMSGTIREQPHHETGCGSGYELSRVLRWSARSQASWHKDAIRYDKIKAPTILCLELHYARARRGDVIGSLPPRRLTDDTEACHNTPFSRPTTACHSSTPWMKRTYDLLDRLGSMPARKKGKGGAPPPITDGDSSLLPANDDHGSDKTVVDTPMPDQTSRPSSVAESAKSKTTITQEDEDGKPTSSNRTASWYGGSWKSKAPAMTGIDRDSNFTPESTPQRAKPSASTPKRPSASPSKYMANSARRSSKSVPVAATTSLVNVNSKGLADMETKEAQQEPAKQEEAPLPPEPVPPKGDGDNERRSNTEAAKGSDAASTTGMIGSTWRGWWSKPDQAAQNNVEKLQNELAKGTQEEAKQTPLPESPEAAKKPDPLATTQAANGEAVIAGGAVDGANAANQNRSSWFWAWSKAENAKGSQPPPEVKESTKSVAPAPEVEQQARKSKAAPAPSADATSEAKETAKPASNASTSSWAFWSREKTGPGAASDTGSTRKEVGELAVANTPSQTNPEAAQFNEQRETPKKEAPSVAKKARGRLKVNESSSNASTPAKVTPAGSPSREPNEVSSPKPVVQSAPQGKKKGTVATQPQNESQPTLNTRNALLPKFDGTYHPSDSPSYWEQIRRFFVRTGPVQPRVHLEPDPPRVRRALAVGVHGFFPAAILRQVLGQPTGTSIKFSNYAASAIKEWVRQHGDYECEIEKVALEGEGFIADRVDTLWKLLLNWIDKIRKADLIIVAAHSQGVPVATMLVAKLIQFGCVNANARIGICAMAGINMGPFVEYRTSWLGGTANELFEFSRPDSKVSIMYEEALEECLRHGVRICYVGSIDDQLVSLEVSTDTKKPTAQVRTDC